MKTNLLKFVLFQGAIVMTLWSPFLQNIQAATNLIANPSAETSTNNSPTGWLNSSWGTNSATFTYPSTGQSGTKSLTVKMNSYTSGDAKWYFTPVSVSPNQFYTFSDYYKATVATDLVAQISDASGKLDYLYIGAVSKSTSWKKANFSFTTPANSSKLTIFHLINQVGTLQTDNSSLAEEIAQPVVITDNVPNNSVEQSSSINQAKPNGWQTGSWGTNSATFTYLNNLGNSGTRAIKTEITSFASGDAKWYYDAQAAAANTKLRFTDYYQSNITSRVVVEVTNSDQTKSYTELKAAPASQVWAKYTDTFTTGPTAVKLTVFHLVSEVGYLVTDDYRIVNYLPEGFNRTLLTLTFDDGFDSQYTIGKPMLENYRFPATFYITTGFVGTDGYMTGSMISGLKSAGNQIASHTVTHPHLPTLSNIDVTNEIINSKTYLQSNFGVSANDFASPFGEVNNSVLTTVKQNFRSHRGVIAGFNYKDFDIYNIKVQNILVTTTTTEVNNWLAQAAANKTWLILVYHQIYLGGDTYSVTPTNFTDQLGAIYQNNLPVVTLDQALTELLPQVNN